jgi:hypothetical protein
VDGQVALAGAQAGQCLGDGGGQFRGGNVGEDKEAGRVGMSRQVAVRLQPLQHVQRGMLQCMVTACGKDGGKVEDHGTIILLNT